MNQAIRHLAIIMDGNGRWALKQGLKRFEGHLKGTENVRDIALACHKLKIEVLTVYAFSTENWRRPIEEINYLMQLPALFFKRFLPELQANNIKIMMIGSYQKIPTKTQKVLKDAIKATQDNTGMILNFAFNYGGQAEIVNTTNQLIKLALDKKIKAPISESDFEKHLLTADLPPVDLLIRTSGEQRLSNFLLWQIAYSELYFSEKPWPSFTEADLNEIINEYQKRERRFGGL